jgi:hypothetical protein
MTLSAFLLMTGIGTASARDGYSQESHEPQQSKSRITGTVVDRRGEPVILQGSTQVNESMKNKQNIRGLKARQSSAQGNALWRRRLSTPEAPEGRNLFVRIPPRQGLAFAGHSFRRALPCAVDHVIRGHPPAASGRICFTVSNYRP